MNRITIEGDYQIPAGLTLGQRLTITAHVHTRALDQEQLKTSKFSSSSYLLGDITLDTVAQDCDIQKANETRPAGAAGLYERADQFRQGTCQARIGERWCTHDEGHESVYHLADNGICWATDENGLIFDVHHIDVKYLRRAT